MADSKRARIWRRTWFGALLGGGTIGLVLWAHGPAGREVALGAGVALALLSLFELARMARAPGSRLALGAAPLGTVAVLGGAAYILAPSLFDWLPGGPAAVGSAARGGQLLLVCCLIGALSMSVAGVLRARPGGVLFVSLWIAFPLLALSLVREGHGGQGLLALLLLSKVGDIAGYYVGNALGRTHPFPRLSPGKTTEGCLGSLVAGILTGVLCQQLGWLGEPTLGVLSGMVFGALINVAAQAGDLLESLAKRRAGVKDSSLLFGPSGGTLDVVDSLLLSVPAGLAVWPWLFRGMA